MGRFKTWIYREYTWGEIFFYVPICSVLLGVATILPVSMALLLSGVRLTEIVTPAMQAEPLWLLGLLLVRAPISEEFVFRLLPLGLARERTESLPILLFVAGASSIVFGYVHGGWANIPMQGTVGFGYALVFLKAGGIRGALIKPFVASIVAHAAWNFYVFMNLFWRW